MENALVLADARDVGDAVAEIFVATANAAVSTHGRFVVALPGDESANALYEILTQPGYRDRIPWDRTHIVFTDERNLPETDPRTSFNIVREALLDRLPAPGPAVHRLQGEMQHPARAAHIYEEELQDLFPGQSLPRLDLTILAVQPDGTTAALLPGTDALEERSRWVVANYLAERSEWRLTLTLPALGASALTLLLATGADRSDVVAEAFGGKPHAVPHPCELLLSQARRLEIFLDEAAAAGCLARA